MAEDPLQDLLNDIAQFQASFSLEGQVIKQWTHPMFTVGELRAIYTALDMCIEEHGSNSDAENAREKLKGLGYDS